MKPHHSQSSRENATPSSGTSPLASFKEVPTPREFFATLWSYTTARLRRITFKFGSFSNFKALFPVVSKDFP